MKAYLVREKDEFCATVVFAETRGKAKSMALSTECCEDADFCNIEVHRQPRLDKYYVFGKTEMRWDNPQDRITLVREAGFYCNDDCRCSEECNRCPAKEWCDECLNSESEEI